MEMCGVGKTVVGKCPHCKRNEVSNMLLNVVKEGTVVEKIIEYLNTSIVLEN
jgi:hypothetical protein